VSLVRDKLFWSAFANHAQHTVAASKLLVEMLQHPERRDALATDIKDLEHRGDVITRETVQALHQTWITPLDREEIHGLITRLDDVLDVLDSVSERVSLYEIDEARPESIELARILSSSAEEISQAVSMLVEIKDAELILVKCRAIYSYERDADRIFRGALARLFREGGDPIAIIKWRDIFDALETATDRAEDVANAIEGIILEHA
jgi:predicted phosphate transport protein (TIGR00153 family)